MPTSQSTLDSFFAQSPDRLFIADRAGKLVKRSDAFAREVAPLGGAGLLDLVHEDDRLAADAVWGRLHGAEEATSFVCRLRVGSGTYRSYLIEARSAAGGEEVYGSIRPQAMGDAGLSQVGKLLRAVIDNIPMALWAIDSRADFILVEGKALAAAGLTPGQLVGMNFYDAFAERPDILGFVDKARAGEPGYWMYELYGVSWESWYLPMRDEKGEVVAVVGVSLDVSATKRIERDLAAKLQAIESQQEIIRSLATPIIQVWDGVLTMPLVGVVDSMRAADVMDGLLNEVVRTRARFAVLDVTGVDVMDTATAGHLIRLIRSIRLLGAEGIITGIRPSIAHTMVGIGVEMTSIITLQNLREGLRYCIDRMAEDRRADPGARY